LRKGRGAVAGLLAVVWLIGSTEVGPKRVRAQQPGGVATLAQLPAVRRALELARTTENETLDDQIRFCETAAPPFQEGARAELLRRAFTDLGLQDVHLDRAGNVVAERPGTSAHPHVVVAAHLDTVFPPETDVKVTRAGTRLTGPGIGDNCRGLAVLVAVARVMRSAGLRTTGPVTLVANVGEEGLGDLRGMRELFGVAQRGASARRDIDRFVSIDGPGLFVVNSGVGSRRYRVTFKGPGGHSYAAFGTPSPIGALGRAVAKIEEIQVPAQPRTTFNVGRIGGGTSVNAIASEAWMEVDLRSSEAASLAALEARFRAAVESSVSEENARWGRPRTVTVSIDLVGDRPVGNISAASPIVQTAQAAARALGFTAVLSEASTDSNLPLSLGIAAVTVGGGGDGTDAHAPDESFDGTEAWKGTQHVLLLLAALAQP
jgi:acetylornithine deacetylase/succinyl-diaminopimelate desuccinylase-like protein